MKISIQRKELLTIISEMNSISPRKSSFAILQNVMIQAIQNTVHFISTDLESSICSSVQCDVEIEGSITTPTRILRDVIYNMPECIITLDVKGDNIVVSGNRSKFKLYSLPSDDFPASPFDKECSKQLMTIESEHLFKLIEQTLFSVSKDVTRSHLNSVLFCSTADVLRMVSTDGHRLTKSEIQVEEKHTNDFSFVVSSNGIKELLRLLKSTSEPVDIVYSDKDIFFKVKDNCGLFFGLSIKLIDSDFPPFEKVIPTACETSLTIERSKLIDVIKRTISISTQDCKNIKLTLSNESIVIANDVAGIGSSDTTIDVVVSGPSIEIGLNAKYLLDALKVLSCDEVTMEFMEKSDPIIVKDQDEFICVIMPIKI